MVIPTKQLVRELRPHCPYIRTPFSFPFFISLLLFGMIVSNFLAHPLLDIGSGIGALDCFFLHFLLSLSGQGLQSPFIFG